MQESAALDAGIPGDYVEAPKKVRAVPCNCDGRIAEIGIAEDVRIVETAFAKYGVRIDCEPATWTEVEHILVVDVAVEGQDIARFRKQRAGDRVSAREQAAVRARDGAKWFEPYIERCEIRRWLGARHV